MMEVRKTITIRRPVDEVQAQFQDLAYHERRGHHRGVTFVVSSESEESCGYSQTSQFGQLRLRQKFRLDRDDASHQVNELVSGPFSPGSITFDIVDSADGAIVTATLQSTRRGVTQLAAPLLRRVLTRALAQGLDEDRADLESGDYVPGRSVDEG